LGYAEHRDFKNAKLKCVEQRQTTTDMLNLTEKKKETNE
jgi:hypothetical protein